MVEWSLVVFFCFLFFFSVHSLPTLLVQRALTVCSGYALVCRMWQSQSMRVMWFVYDWAVFVCASVCVRAPQLRFRFNISIYPVGRSTVCIRHIAVVHLCEFALCEWIVVRRCRVLSVSKLDGLVMSQMLRQAPIVYYIHIHIYIYVWHEARAIEIPTHSNSDRETQRRMLKFMKKKKTNIYFRTFYILHVCMFTCVKPHGWITFESVYMYIAR